MNDKRIRFIILTCFALLSPKGAASTLSLKQAIEMTLHHNPVMQTIESQKEIHPLEIFAQKNTWHPKWLLSMHGDWEKMDEGVYHGESKKVGVTPSMQWVSPLGTQLDLQATQFEGSGQGLKRHTRWQMTLEQPLLKGGNWRVNTQPLRELSLTHQKTEHQHWQQQGQILYAVIQDYVALVNLMSQVNIQVHRLKAHRQYYQIILEKIKMGRLPEVDGLMHEMTTAKLEQNLSQSRMHVQHLKDKLSESIGVELDESVELLGLNWHPIQTRTQEDYTELSKRYHLEPMRLDLQSFEEQEKVIRHQSLWDLRIKAYMARGKRHYIADDEMLDIELHEHDHADKQRFIGLFLSIPFNANPNQALMIKQNKLNRYKTKAQLNSTQMKTAHKMSQLYGQLTHLAQQHRLNQKSLSLAKKTSEIMWQKYLAGFSSHFELEQAQSLELQAAMDVENSQTNLFLAQVELDYFAGLLPKEWRSYV